MTESNVGIDAEKVPSGPIFRGCWDQVLNLITVDGNDWLPSALREFRERPVEGVDYILLSEGDNGILNERMQDTVWLSNRNDAIKAYYATPDGKAACTVRNREVNNRPEVRAHRSATFKATWADPIIRKRRLDSIAATNARKKAAKLAAESACQ